jgi:hypothetical protein
MTPDRTLQHPSGSASVEINTDTSVVVRTPGMAENTYYDRNTLNLGANAYYDGQGALNMTNNTYYESQRVPPPMQSLPQGLQLPQKSEILKRSA